jgi:tRNA 2-thiocytidine biosynthesis protein TtcA
MFLDIEWVDESRPTLSWHCKQKTRESRPWSKISEALAALDSAGASGVKCAPSQGQQRSHVPELSRKEKTQFNKLQKRLRRNVGNAIADYSMIEEGDRVMVCLSGGKDSYGMLDILLNLRSHAPVEFELIAVNLDQKQPGFPEEVLPAYLAALDVPYYILEKDTYSIVREVVPEGKTTCGLCSRLRRGNLYGFAQEIGASKIALGHHRDDIVETLFLNMFFNGSLKAMPPKLLSDDKKNVVIRPLAYCKEKDLASYAAYKAFPIIPCNLCGSQENLQRVQVKKMLANWEREYPGRTETIFRSIRNIAPSQLADLRLFDFNSLRALPDPSPGADLAVDKDLYFPAIRAVNL